MSPEHTSTENGSVSGTMVAGELQLTVEDQTLEFEPSDEECGVCGTAAGYSHAVEMTVESPETTTVAVAFRCDSCGTDVETVTRTVATPDGIAGDSLDDEARELADWIDDYLDEEGRPPSKSTCVQSAPFDVREAQRLLDELVERGRIEETEELRATNRVTVYRPA